MAAWDDVRRIALALPQATERESRGLCQWRVKDIDLLHHPNFDGYAAILVRLDRIGAEALDETITEAWLVRAPKRLAQVHRRVALLTRPSPTR